MDDFLEIDPKSLSNEALVEMISALRDHEKHRQVLAKLMREQVLRALKDSSLSLKQVVRALSGSRVKKDRERIAKEWCVALGISEEEFKRIASGK